MKVGQIDGKKIEARMVDEIFEYEEKKRKEKARKKREESLARRRK